MGERRGVHVYAFCINQPLSCFDSHGLATSYVIFTDWAKTPIASHLGSTVGDIDDTSGHFRYDVVTDRVAGGGILDKIRKIYVKLEVTVYKDEPKTVATGHITLYKAHDGTRSDWMSNASEYQPVYYGTIAHELGHARASWARSAAISGVLTPYIGSSSWDLTLWYAVSSLLDSDSTYPGDSSDFANADERSWFKTNGFEETIPAPASGSTYKWIKL